MAFMFGMKGTHLGDLCIHLYTGYYDAICFTHHSLCSFCEIRTNSSREAAATELASATYSMKL